MPYAPLRDDVRVHFDDVGDPARPSVLLLGPAGSDSSAWTFQMQEIARRYRTIVIDHRGAGHTEYPSEDFAISDLAEDACGLLDHLRIDNVALVGVSMGGCVALEMTLRHPGRVWALVLAATTPGGRLSSMSHGDRLELLRDAASAPPGVRGHRLAELYYGPRALATDPEAYRSIIARAHWDAERTIDPDDHPQNRAISSFNVARHLRRINVDTLVLHGDDDVLIPFADATRLADAISGARFDVLPGGHLFFMQSATQFNRVVLDFLATREAHAVEATS